MNNLHIAINCRSILRKKYTGIGRYTFHLVKLLSEIDPHNEYKLYAKKGLLNVSKKLPRFRVPNFFVKTDRFNHGVEKSLGHMDIYHSPSPDTLTINNGAKIVVTVHDLIFKTFPQGHTQKTLDQTEKQFEHIGQRATKIICCSKNTMTDLKTYFDIPDEKIDLVYQGVDKSVFYRLDDKQMCWANRLIKKHGIHDPFILTVGTIEPRKNLENILQAFDKLKTRRQFKGKLVVIGMKGWMSDGIESLIRKLELRHDVIFLGYLSDKELRAFYNKAEVFLFPSFYEGFGFPIVEAYCCGTPVVTSNVSSCPEVAGDAAYIINPYQPDDIAEAVYHIVSDEKLAKNLVRKGYRRSQDFDFEKTARETLKVYQRAYEMS